MRFAITLLLAITLALPVAAQTQAPPPVRTAPRQLEVPANTGWQHAETGMVLPSRVAGASRTRITDSTEQEQDIIASYADPETELIVTVYIYRTLTPDVALWFDRALFAIQASAETPLAPTTTPFTPPGAPTATGLRAVMTGNRANMRSTAVAVAPLGDWLVKIRISSGQLEPAALDTRLSAFLSGLRWPAQGGAARAAVPIVDCQRPLRLRQARLIPVGGADVLMDAVLSGALRREPDATPPPVYCREPGSTLTRGVYRADGSTRAYLMALGDAGIAISVGQTTSISALATGDSRPRYAVSLLGRETADVLPSFDRLPLPEQLLALLNGGRPLAVSRPGR